MRRASYGSDDYYYYYYVISAVYDDWPVVVGNIWKAKKSWGQLLRILSREGADPKVSGYFFKAVTQAVLLFGVDTWVITPRMEWALSSFRHRVERKITGRQQRIQGGGSW